MCITHGIAIVVRLNLIANHIVGAATERCLSLAGIGERTFLSCLIVRVQINLNRIPRCKHLKENKQDGSN